MLKLKWYSTEKPVINQKNMTIFSLEKQLSIFIIIFWVPGDCVES